MAKRGRKTNAEKAQAAEAAKATATAEEKTEDATLDLSGGDRDALYDKYSKEEGGLIDDSEASAEKEETEEKTDETPSEEEEATDTSAEEEVTVGEEETEEKVEEELAEGEKDKTVPLSALHEEREKRKSLSSKLAERDAQIRDLLQDYKQRFETTEKPGEEEELDEVGQLRKEINELKHWRTGREDKSKRDEVEAKIAKTDAQIVETDAKLEKEGYPGFSFTTTAITKELHRLVKEDPDNIYLDSQAGWEKIYKEKIFPTLRSKFIKKDKEDLFDKKKDLKSNAQLTSGGIKPEATEKKEEEWTYADYLQMRYDKQL